MKIERLIEARKNPAQNKKVGLLQSLKEFANTLDKLPNGKINGFISFSFLLTSSPSFRTVRMSKG